MKGGDPLRLLTPCHSNTKVSPGGGDGAQGRLGQRGERTERLRDSFLCLPHCLPAHSFPLSPYLAVLPLTCSQRPLFFFLSFVAMPLPHCLFTFFCLAGILLRNYYSFSPPPSTLSPPFYLCAHLSSSGGRFIWKQQVERGGENYSSVFVCPFLIQLCAHVLL